jgi:hypothetical protein
VALLHLLPITLVPFTTMIMARYISLAPAIWLYATNTILFALIAIRMDTVAKVDRGRGALLEDQLGLIVLIVASVLTIIGSLAIPKWAMLVYLVNLADAPLRWLLKRKAYAQK